MILRRGKIKYEREINPITGEQEDFAKVPVDEDTVISVDSAKAIEERKKQMKIVAYRKKGKRKEPFVQAMPAYEKNIVGKYSPEMLECLFRTLPYMNYNGDNIVNAGNLIKVNGIPANDTSLAKLWGISRQTAIKYIEQFIEDEIWERKQPEGYVGNAYRFKKNVFLKGAKGDKDYFSKKVVLEGLSRMMDEADRERDRIMTRPYTSNEKEFAKLTSCHPIALLGALLIKTDYKSFFLVNNASLDVIVKPNETVVEVLDSSHKRRRFKFLKVYEMWNLYSKSNTNKLTARQKLELNACLYILKRIKALGKWETGKSEYYIMNPRLVYISPNLKCDEKWYSVIDSLFKLTEAKMGIKEKNKRLP
ncbi:hypothetical protein [Bacillus sp. FJAT-28004]|uniref:hypothetical protein n=1 Tax=Bacillus sp. FJAT-28004 TaxID=1679165 RepID=UPI0006B5F0ED|nr:hypothetical protein [Bacillus sp. FJAT-28004]